LARTFCNSPSEPESNSRQPKPRGPSGQCNSQHWPRHKRRQFPHGFAEFDHPRDIGIGIGNAHGVGEGVSAVRVVADKTSFDPAWLPLTRQPSGFQRCADVVTLLKHEHKFPERIAVGCGQRWLYEPICLTGNVSLECSETNTGFRRRAVSEIAGRSRRATFIGITARNILFVSNEGVENGAVWTDAASNVSTCCRPLNAALVLPR